MKKIAIFGVGAQGSTIARRMNEHPDVSEIICADYDSRAAEELSSSLDKAERCLFYLFEFMARMGAPVFFSI